MTTESSYTPFLIGTGTSKTGLFGYLDSWVKPEDAFDTLVNAYVYRGSLYQRMGMIPFPSIPGNGALVYQNNDIARLGDGSNSYFGTVGRYPIIGTVTITALTVAGIRSSTATFGVGTRPWSTGGAALATAGGINFAGGNWTITTSSNIAADVPIVIQYNFVPTSAFLNINNPIMGIKTFINETTNEQILVVADTRRASWYNESTLQFVPIEAFRQTIWTFTGTTATTGSITTQWINLAPYSLTVNVYKDDGSLYVSTTDVAETSTLGHWTATAVGPPDIQNTASTINYATSVIIVPFNANVPKNYTVEIIASLQGDYFTGNNTNFFNSTNWRPNDQQKAFLYLTNNKDFVTLFDGTYLARPPFGITLDNVNKYVNDIATTLDVKVFQEQLLFLRPTLLVSGVPLSNPEAQWIYFSRPMNPPDFAQDITGHGGSISAPTGDWIQSAQFLRNDIVVFFTNSTWLFRFTGNAFDPYRFIQISNSRSTNAPYGSVSYDQYCTSMGNKGLISCDGINVDRYDINIIDQFLDINFLKFAQCFAQKFDSLNQTWMLYPSEEQDSQTSDSVIVYNYLENTWAIFRPNLGLLTQDLLKKNTLSCLGIGATTRELTWADFGPNGIFPNYTWSQVDWAWNNNANQSGSPLLLAGDQNGFVYQLNIGPVDLTAPNVSNAIPTSALTKQFSPYVAQGQKSRFGYLDVYYEINSSVQINFNFYINNSVTISKSATLTLNSPNPEMQTGWKRIYLNLVGQFIQWEISTLLGFDVNDNPIYTTAGTFKILGQILHAMPAGRLTPGTFT
jgi:hypothetical protein